RERAASNAAPLRLAEEGDERAWEINDAVRDWVDGRGSDVDERLRTIPKATWAFVIGRATEDGAFAVGTTANIRGCPEAAAEAWTKAATGASPETSCPARLHLGLVALEAGRHAQALEAFDAAVNGCAEAPGTALGDVVAGALFGRGLAMRGLGRSHDEVGAWEEFLSRYGEAPDGSGREQVVTAFVRKGEALVLLGRGTDAVEAFDTALSRL